MRVSLAGVLSALGALAVAVAVTTGRLVLVWAVCGRVGVGVLPPVFVLGVEGAVEDSEESDVRFAGDWDGTVVPAPAWTDRPCVTGGDQGSDFLAPGRL